MRGHIRERGKGTWAIVIDVGQEEGGKRRQKWFTVKGTKRDAERELTKLLRELDTGGYVDPTRMTVGEYLAKWLEDSARNSVAAKTFERYAGIVTQHLQPNLGHYLLNKLQPLHIQGYYAQALRDGKLNGKGGLSAQTVLHHHRVLKEALQQAVKWQLLARNPADAVEPPKPQRHEMNALDEAQTAALLEAAKETYFYIAVVLAVTTGMRRGEILGLRWQDIDLKRGTAAVRQAIEQTKAGIAFKQPKTQKSRRSVALPGMAVEELKHYEAAQAQEKLLLRQDYQDSGLVCARADGRPLDPAEMTHAFSRLISKTDLPQIRFHDLRHTHATLLLRQGIPAKVVSERLGHSTVGITLDTYSHVLPGMQEEAANRIDAALRSAVEKKRA